MRLEEAINSLLSTKFNNFYPIILPQNKKPPAVIYTSVSINRASALFKDTGFTKQIIQFSCMGDSYKVAVNLAQKLREQLQNFNGEISGVSIDAVIIVSETVNYESNTGIYIVNIEIEFQFTDKGEIN